MKNAAHLVLLIALFTPAWARPPVAPGTYTPFQPSRTGPTSLSFNARMVGLTYPKTSWEVPVARARPGALVLQRNPNQPPGQGDEQALRYAPGPWPGTAWFSLKPAGKPWNLRDLYVSSQTLANWGQLPTAPFDSPEEALKLMRDYYAWALTQARPEDDANLVTFLLKRGFNPQASQALLTQQEMSLSMDPEFQKIVQNYYGQLKHRQRK